MANLWSWPPPLSQFCDFMNFQVTAFGFVSAKGLWKEGESGRTPRRRKKLVTSNWSRVKGCKWEMCNHLLSRLSHNPISSLCRVEVSRSHLQLKWNFCSTENPLIVFAMQGETALGHCDVPPWIPAIQPWDWINKTGIQLEIFCTCPYPQTFHTEAPKAKLFASRRYRLGPWRAGRRASLSAWAHHQHSYQSLSCLLAQRWLTAAMLCWGKPESGFPLILTAPHICDPLDPKDVDPLFLLSS